ncbi:MAG: cadherin-like beta sandwich domain-containing protein [Akkermansiaceae bacterium]|nr:cadherin-like beta sandwich domain-containing protein [Akkermansiaceae bacterium]
MRNLLPANLVLAVLAGMALALPAFATVNIEWVTVGDLNNPADTVVMGDGTSGYGSVNYAYQIAQNDTTISQYCEFLNAVAKSDPYKLYNWQMAIQATIAGILKSGSSGNFSYSVMGTSGNKPITFVGWFDAARFCNWMHNGQGGGSTETGAYTLNGAMDGIILKNSNATVWIPTENEWYKAAYYDPTKRGSHYWAYPMQCDTPAGNTIGVAHSANFNGYGTTDVGAYGANSASHYGTNDQGGNVYQWNDAVINGTNRGLRGAPWWGGGATMISLGRYSGTPSTSNLHETAFIGFRIAGAVVQPSATSLPASAISGTRATLNGSVNANGAATTVSFQYGLTSSYGATIAASPTSVTGTSTTLVSAGISGLLLETTYHYRVVAANFGGTTYGADMTFTTLSDNASLAALSLSVGTLVPGFDKLTTSYIATVPFPTDSVTVTPVTEHPGASVQINGVPVAIGTASSSISLPVGSSPITTFVTAEDTITTKSYTITVTRLPENFVFNSASDVPVTANGFVADGYPVNIILNYAPTPGTVLTMVNNTGLGFIDGTFSNLARGQLIGLTYNGVTYDFVVWYHGGGGNDLVLRWAATRVVAWGSNNFGQLGDTTTTRRLVPAPVDATGVLAGKTITAVSEGYLHSLALCSDGTLAAWGYNVYGQLGNSSAVASSVPVAVDRSGVLAEKAVIAIAAGPFHNLALCSDGTVAAWGYNNYGQLGTGDTATSRVPVLVAPTGALAGKQVVAVAAGAYHSFALCDDGTLAAWGFNDDGELGDGSTNTSPTPVAVDTSGALAGKRIASLSTGLYHTLALCSDGTLFTWGYDNHGQLGANSLVSSKVPVAIGGFGALAGKAVSSVRAGGSHSLALCTDGTLSAWGWNNDGQLGVAGLTQSSIPVAIDMGAVTASTTLAQIAVGGNHSLALGADGRLLAWGDNAGGQLGDNSLTQSAVAVAVDLSGLAEGARCMTEASGSAAHHNLAVFGLPSGAAAQNTARPQGLTDTSSGQDAASALIAHAFGLYPDPNTAGQLPQGKRVGDNYVIEFTQPPGVTGITYGGECSATLLPGSWTAVPDTGTGSEHIFSVPLTGGKLFMRLKVTGQ